MRLRGFGLGRKGEPIRVVVESREFLSIPYFGFIDSIYFLPLPLEQHPFNSILWIQAKHHRLQRVYRYPRPFNSILWIPILL